MKKYFFVLCILFTYLSGIAQNNNIRRVNRKEVKQTLPDTISKTEKLINNGNQTDYPNNLPTDNNSRQNRRVLRIYNVKLDSSIINEQTTKENTTDIDKQNNEIKDRRTYKKQLEEKNNIQQSNPKDTERKLDIKK